jgi:hypothetical protein
MLASCKVIVFRTLFVMLLNLESQEKNTIPVFTQLSVGQMRSKLALSPLLAPGTASLSSS